MSFAHVDMSAIQETNKRRRVGSSSASSSKSSTSSFVENVDANTDLTRSSATLECSLLLIERELPRTLPIIFKRCLIWQLSYNFTFYNLLAPASTLASILLHWWTLDRKVVLENVGGCPAADLIANIRQRCPYYHWMLFRADAADFGDPFLRYRTV